MAGIGFELRKVFAKGGLANVFSAALSGILIVAGPWILTIITIFVIRLYFTVFNIASQGLFQAAIVYSFAFSLSLFSGLHYLFTRMIADLLWENKQRQASSWLIYYAVFTALASAGIAALVMFSQPVGDVAHPLFFRLGSVFLFVSINLLWLVMLFISLLKQYVRIMLVYVAGMVASIGLVVWWGQLWGAAGAVSGFAAGHFLIVVALATMSFLVYPPRRPKHRLKKLKTYYQKYFLLVLSGLFFYCGQWTDKIFFWINRGTPVEGSFFRLFDQYDLPVYLAGLSIIPGLVYFVIFCETAFYRALNHFLHSLLTVPYNEIQKSKYEMIRVLKAEVGAQNVFQAVFTSLGVILAMWLMDDVAMRNHTILVLGAMYFQLLFMTLTNFLYYFELYRQAFVAALIFILLNGLVFPVLYYFLPDLTPGLGYLVSAFTSAVVTWFLLTDAAKTIERRIFSRAMA